MEATVTKYKLHDTNLYLPPLIRSDQHLTILHSIVRRLCAQRCKSVIESCGRSRDQKRCSFVVLCVDDSKVILKSTSHILHLAGCVVHTASNGLEALNIIYRRPPSYFDMILTDIEMPLMNGIDFVRMFREYERSSFPEDCTTHIRTPVFCISSTMEGELRNSAVSSGADIVMDKPFNTTLLHMAFSFKISRSEQLCNKVPRKTMAKTHKVESMESTSELEKKGDRQSQVGSLSAFTL